MTTTLRVGDTIILDHDGVRQEYVLQKADVYEETQYVIINDERSSKKTRYATLSLVGVGAPLGGSHPFVGVAIEGVPPEDEPCIVDIHETQR